MGILVVEGISGVACAYVSRQQTLTSEDFTSSRELSLLNLVAPIRLLITGLPRIVAPIVGALAGSAADGTRTCVACGRPVRDDQGFLRYRGEYYHAEPCVEQAPPALGKKGRPVDAAAGQRGRAR